MGLIVQVERIGDQFLQIDFRGAFEASAIAAAFTAVPAPLVPPAAALAPISVRTPAFPAAPFPAPFAIALLLLRLLLRFCHPYLILS
jgi:hypothetical protein